MYPSLVLSAALVAPAAPLPRDTAPNTTGPAPRVLALKADASGQIRVIGSTPVKVTVTNTHFVIETVVVNGKQVQKQVQKQVEQDVVTSQYTNRALGEFGAKFLTADGTPLTPDEAAARIKNGATVLASADGKPVAKTWLQAAAPGTVVMVAEGLAHVQLQYGIGGALPTTAGPRLAMLGADSSGKVLTACTSQPLGTDGAYYGDVMFDGGGRAFRGGRVYYGGFNQNTDAKVVVKPLADVKFDAFDLNGKLVPRSEALKRLAAGGTVLVAGDNQVPDETYLKGFREDVLVLVGPELVLPIPPIDQTKKKDPAPEPKAVPAAPGGAVRPLPAVVKPGVIMRAPAVGAAAPAPAVEKK
ncbi:hypothetical protein [Frigoriglobus tundricola]|uniref:Phosphodiester glycosidase domain-containing protein n=1 Tax=Frigoriglobus tundricola TaxID=2774151 RepID=A0A6M5YPF9_9BACT|nr:hypothetical protein [Frigoriglobus tundricola]QJW95290.1 hypothetical protein FTUN_2832 [Frigoriglobus tundricola]